MPQADREALLAFDRRHLWHPYASMGGADALPVVSASGVRLQLADGRELVDGMSSWWAAIHGYAVPQLDAAVHEQLRSMAHLMFGGLTHEPAVRLAEQLLSVCPAALQKVFFCDSGSVAMEVAIKMVLQRHRHRRPQDGRPGRLLSVRGAYHGDTFGALAISDPEQGGHALFPGVVAGHLFAPRPAPRFGLSCTDAHIRELQGLLLAHREEIAAVVLEPILQGAGGMWTYSAEYLQRVRSLCTRCETPLILDEIATGFGRTGTLFAAEHAGVSPDILCVGKALTGGYLSLAAVLCSDEIAAEVCGPQGQPLMHGPTFMANPLACSVASASIELLLQSPWRQRVQNVETILREELMPLGELPGVADVRCLGAVGVVELEQAPAHPAALQNALVEGGVWLRPFGRLVYTMPPYPIGEEDLRRIGRAIADALHSGVHLPA